MADTSIPTVENPVEEKPKELSEEQKLKAKYPGGLKKNFAQSRLQNRGGVKYFDSGDYNMAKTTGNKSRLPGLGAAIPKPEDIPHRKQSVPSKLASPTSVSVQD
ncbi:alpha-endosulfine-like [Dendronephthya gigantea]|uniref:alpha-endosulfine-like n=1 Tax=Dendronephthya gigantea TaxID=151771 RepID=UPI00106CED7C|nr:alpha-endosulfine-like [Dendronephthya gigantea]